MEEKPIEVRNTRTKQSKAQSVKNVLKGRINNKNKKKKFTEKLKLKDKKVNFGFTRIFIITLLLTIVIQIFYTSIQLYQKPKFQELANYLTVYSLSSDIWTTIQMVHHFLLETVGFNNSIPCWNGKTSLGCYEEIRDYINDELLVNITKTADLYLGNFTENFSYTLTKVTLMLKFF